MSVKYLRASYKLLMQIIHPHRQLLPRGEYLTIGSTSVDQSIRYATEMLCGKSQSYEKTRQREKLPKQSGEVSTKFCTFPTLIFFQTHCGPYTHPARSSGGGPGYLCVIDALSSSTDHSNNIIAPVLTETGTCKGVYTKALND
jgi:hypothetical protein